MDLKNKVVIITGSSSGIGKTTAKAFACKGAKIILNYHVNNNAMTGQVIYVDAGFTLK